ncbi:MAG TPA: hypothetical protein VGF69_20005 [Thermoanaerobaculia bacterium]
MTFYVNKSLAHGPIRFGVTPRQTLEAIDDDPSLSTGAAGEFLRRRTTGFYFADTKAINAPVLPTAKSIRSMPFWKSLLDGTPRGWGFIALMVLGVLLILLGFSVIITRAEWQGWFEVILGIAMIVTPIVLTAQRRRKIREQEEKERAEREERERRHREMLAAYVSALEQLRRDPSDAALATATRERQALELPYEIWSPLAKRTVLYIGFEALSNYGVARSREVANLIDRASRAVGLTPEDETGVRLDLYRAIVWHLLADDRDGDAQMESLKTFRKGFDIWDKEVPVEAKAAEEFRRLRGINKENLPRQTSALQLGFHEYCILSARAQILRKKRRDAGSLYLTNRRLVLEPKGSKQEELLLPKIDDVEVDMDANILTIRTARGLNDIRLEVDDPIYTAALIDLATNLDERPRGFS